MRNLLSLLMLSLCGIALAEPQPEEPVDALARVKEAGSIEFAVYADFPPYSYMGKDGTPAGIDVDLAKALAARLGLQPRLRLFHADENEGSDLRNQVWKGHYLGGGVADVMLHAGYDTQYAARESRALLFSPYFHESVCVLYRPERVRNLTSPLQLAEYKVAVAGGTISDYIVSSGFNGALRGAAVHEATLIDAVDAFKSGEVDAVMAPRGEVQGLLAEQKVSDVAFRQTELVGIFRTSWDVGMAVKNTGNTSLRDALREALDGLRKEGALERIFAAHGVEYIASPDDASSAEVLR